MGRPWHWFWLSLHLLCAWTVGSLCSAPAAEAMTLTLIWSPSAQSDVIGYHVYYGLASRQYTRMLDAGDAATAVLPDLSPGTTYFLAVTAYNGLGIESLPS